MGFNLEMFFLELKDILSMRSVPAEEKVRILKILIEDSEKYARECGNIK